MLIAAAAVGWMAMDRPRLEIGIDSQDPFRLAPFWVAALGYEGTRGDAAPYLDLIAPEGSTGVFLQQVPEPKSTKNRLHLDLFTDEPEELMGRLEALGATRLGEPFGGNSAWSWQVMADPEGNEFSICREIPAPG